MTATAQPKWRQVGIIGDRNFAEYGGGPAFVDETGVYCPELEYVDVVDDGSGDAFVYRVMLENLKLSPAGALIPAAYDATWHYPVESYTEWYFEHLERVAQSCGIQRSEIISFLISPDPMQRAIAVESLANYLGWENFDSYPLHLTAKKLEARYKDHPYLRAK